MILEISIYNYQKKPSTWQRVLKDVNCVLSPLNLQCSEDSETVYDLNTDGTFEECSLE